MHMCHHESLVWIHPKAVTELRGSPRWFARRVGGDGDQSGGGVDEDLVPFRVEGDAGQLDATVCVGDRLEDLDVAAAAVGSARGTVVTPKTGISS